MGLTLCYRMTLPGHTGSDTVREKLAALKDFSETLGFDQVLGPTEYTVDELIEAARQRDIVGIVATTMCGDPPDFYGVPAGGKCAFAFLAMPGEECDPAIFGFVAPGSRDGSPEDAMCPSEWFWSGCCKTQYASLISDDHLLKCHLGLVRLLEHASTLGIAVQVEDETGYWEHRSEKKLLESVRDMNRLMARFAGHLHDRMGAGHRVEATIFGHPEFEHLEMEQLGRHEQADGADPETSS